MLAPVETGVLRGVASEVSLPKEPFEMPNIASIIRDHVSLSIRCMDRLYLNGYLPKLQTSGQLAYFMTEHLGFFTR